MIDNDYKLVYIPQLGVNDLKVTVVRWHAKEGMQVKSGDLLCSVESTKTAYDVESEFEGVFSMFFEEGDEVDITDPVGSVFKNKSVYDEMSKELSKKFGKNKTQTQTVTQKAIKKAKELGVDISLITKAGVIKEKDVVDYYSTLDVKKPDLNSLNILDDKNNIVIYGSGKGAITVLETLSFDKKNNVICFIDDDSSRHGLLNNIPVILSEFFLSNFKYLSKIKVACEIANSNFRLNLIKRLEKMGIELMNVIHSDTYISPSVKIGKGNFIKAGAIIDTNTYIGDCCIIDNGVVIPHDNKIGNGCHLAPGVTLGSSIEIGDKSVIGIGASVSTNIKIGRNVIIGVGSSVVSNIPDNSIVEGVPGKIIGTHK
jgi:sugar O-acyltransferase (sialic acid O-acetyltransferase NeuD family)